MAVNLINSDDITITRTGDDLQMNFSADRSAELSIPMIKATMSADYTINATNTIEILPIDIEHTKKGTNLTVESGGVKIGQGINYVLVSGCIYWYQNISGLETISYIYRNDSSYVAINHRNTDNYEHTVFPTTIIPVVEGDVIKLRVQVQGATSPLPIIKNYASGTFLTVVGFK